MLSIHGKEQLTAANKVKRVRYAKDMAGYDWSKVLWTDEKVFYLGSVETMGWQDPKDPQEIEQKRFPPNINVWGGLAIISNEIIFYYTEYQFGTLHQDSESKTSSELCRGLSAKVSWRLDIYARWGKSSHIQDKYRVSRPSSPR